MVGSSALCLTIRPGRWLGSVLRVSFSALIDSVAWLWHNGEGHCERITASSTY